MSDCWFRIRFRRYWVNWHTGTYRDEQEQHCVTFNIDRHFCFSVAVCCIWFFLWIVVFFQIYLPTARLLACCSIPSIVCFFVFFPFVILRWSDGELKNWQFSLRTKKKIVEPKKLNKFSNHCSFRSRCSCRRDVILNTICIFTWFTVCLSAIIIRFVVAWCDLTCTLIYRSLIARELERCVSRLTNVFFVRVWPNVKHPEQRILYIYGWVDPHSR